MNNQHPSANHSSNRNHHDPRGVHNPHSNRVHPHHEEVIIEGMDCDPWAAIWAQWLLQIETGNNPMVVKVDDPFKKPYDNYIVPTGFEGMKSGKSNKLLPLPKSVAGPDLAEKVKLLSKYTRLISDKNKKNDGNKGNVGHNDIYEGVMCLAAPLYQSGGSSYTMYEPVIPGLFHIIFSPMCFYTCIPEYLDRTEDEAFELVKKGLDTVSRLEVFLDGIALETCRVEISPEQNVQINVRRKDNILGISPEEFGGNEKDEFASIKLIAAGYFVFLKPLESGMHILSFKGYNPQYALDASHIQFNVRSAPKNSDTTN